MAGIQYNKVTTILNGINKTNAEKMVNRVTTNNTTNRDNTIAEKINNPINEQ